MKVKVIENGLEKIIETDYIVVDGISLKDMLSDIRDLKNKFEVMVDRLNKKERELIKLTKKL